MGYASRAGRARTSSRNPQAHAICDGCGFRFNHVDLQWQYDYRGGELANLRILRCRDCTDVPQQQLRSFVIPADPVPIQNPRPQDFVAASSSYRYTSGQNSIDARTGIPIVGGNLRTTQSDERRVTQQTGEPPFGLNEEPGTSISVPDDAGGDDPGLPYGATEVPKTGPLT